MARLGELLVSAGLLTIEQVEQALRAQVVWGGRLGTNLVELKLVDLDNLTRALGRQHGLPAALARHFDRSDPELQSLFPPELAHKYSIVPLVYLGAERKIAIACIDPLDAHAHAEVVDAFEIEPASLIVSIGAELRIRYHLERVYQIPRSQRFLRSKGPSSPPFPKFDELDEPPETDPDAQIPPIPQTEIEAIPMPIPAEDSPKQADADDLAILIDAAVDAAITPVEKEPSEPHGRDRRRYVKTLADVTGPMPDTVPLGRIPIRKIVLTPPSSQPIPPLAVVEERPTQTITDAMRSIRRSTHRDKVAELVLATISQFIPACDAAIMLVVRGQVAIGWKWFSRSGDAVPEVAVPVDQPGLIPMAIDRKTTARCDADELEAIDLLLLRALGKTEGDLVVVPVPIGDRVMCLIATATAADAQISLVEEVATAAGTGFARLIRDASR